ncbi:MAG TPA: ornithine cyclodeaminase family protein [Anaerolineae bacterium]|nr:ornithine cyclodeaminase family protein [Anaerolineae bacterium]
MELLALTAAEVRQALPMSAAIKGMKEAFARLSAGKGVMPLRSRVATERGVSLFMPAYAEGDESLAVKVVSVFPDNSQKNLPVVAGVVLVVAADTGMPVALLEGSVLTAIRTGAASGAATDVLARREARVAAIIGSGVQARTQLEAICAVREIEEVRVYSRSKVNRERFVAEVAGRNGITERVYSAETAGEAVAGAEIICAATTSSEPVFAADEVALGAHINGVGSYTAEMQEVDVTGLRGGRVYVDSLEAAWAEAGDLIRPWQAGEIEKDFVVGELGAVLNGEVEGRLGGDDITYFKSVGVAIQDARAAAMVVQRARELGLGQLVSL